MPGVWAGWARWRWRWGWARRWRRCRWRLRIRPVRPGRRVRRARMLRVRRRRPRPRDPRPRDLRPGAPRQRPRLGRGGRPGRCAAGSPVPACPRRVLSARILLMGATGPVGANRVARSSRPRAWVPLIPAGRRTPGTLHASATPPRAPRRSRRPVVTRWAASPVLIGYREPRRRRRRPPRRRWWRRSSLLLPRRRRFRGRGDQPLPQDVFPNNEARPGWYPRQDWGVGRAEAIGYLAEVIGVEFACSACTFCPSALATEKGRACTRHAVARGWCGGQQRIGGLVS